MAVCKNADLSGLNTFGFPSAAKYLCRVSDPHQLSAAIKLSKDEDLPLFILGGGSNLVLSSKVNAVVVKLEDDLVEVRDQDDKSVTVAVGAGKNWHEWVSESIGRGWYGLENLALIPGTVGAAPVQNIGAYGVELCDRMAYLEAWDTQLHTPCIINAEACEFGYRRSRFKYEDAGRYIILKVVFTLDKIFAPVLSYAGLQTLQDGYEGDLPAQSVFDEIVQLRQSKLPDPSVLGNAGSFFENPIVSAEEHQRLKAEFPDLVSFPDKVGRYKLAAGWLIDKAGLKGYRDGAVGVYDKQALVLVHFGGGTAEDLWRLAEVVQTRVQSVFGVNLSPEPRRV